MKMVLQHNTGLYRFELQIIVERGGHVPATKPTADGHVVMIIFAFVNRRKP